ncbi:MAG TPA: hypothetical protein PKI01_12210 [Bacteroidales bacterium]|nr:hypothetical protein [Bacteroidales bacterium]
MEIQVKIENVHIHIPGVEQAPVLTGDQLKTELESLYKAITGMMLNSEARITKYIEEHYLPVRVGISSLDDLDKYAENIKEPTENQNKVADDANIVADDANKLTSKAKTSKEKICIECGKEYKPISNAQRKCKECGKNGITPEYEKQKKAVQNKKWRLKKNQKLTPEKEAELEAVLNEIALSQKKTYVISK